MDTAKALTTFRVTLAAGTFTVHARSIQAAILRAQADALDAGALEQVLTPIHAAGSELAVELVAPENAVLAPSISAKAPVDPALEGTEPPLTGMELRRRLGLLRGRKILSHSTLCLAIRNGLPHHPNPMGRGEIFYWSEVQEFLKHPEPPPPEPRTPFIGTRRGPGRPPKYYPPTGKPRR